LIFVWKEEGTEGKKLALELALSCMLVVFSKNRNGVVIARDERGEQSEEGRKWKLDQW
jgi:hypothetical protein